MNGFIFKAITIGFALLAASLSSASFANQDSSKKNIFSAKLGCMACHQGGSIQADHPTKKKHDASHHINQEKIAPAN